MEKTTPDKTPSVTNLSVDSAVDILRQKIEDAKLRNPQLSLRAFAMRIGLSSGGLSEILAGKRTLTPGLKRKIADKLVLSPKETHDFFNRDLPRKLRAKTDERLTLSQDQFHVISDWWYFAMLCLIRTTGFRNRAQWIARRLGLAVATVEEAWERLFRLGYLAKKGERVELVTPKLRTTDNLRDLSIRKSHLQDLKLIEKAVLDTPMHLRDNTSSTFIINQSDIPKAKEMIRLFQHQFLTEMGREEGDEVYKISIAVYPLTQVDSEKGPARGPAK
jgi:transcriptional regulator with XRE-family HTH domain